MRYVTSLIVLACGLALGGCLHDEDEAGGLAPAPAPHVPPPAPAPEPVAAPSEMFVLGDSLSDVGNAAAVADYLLSLSIFPPTVGLCNPVDVFVLPRPCDDLFYRQSRVSDGPVAVEYLAVHFDLAELVPSLHVVPSRPITGTVYAVASATARLLGSADLANQVDLLLLDHASVLPADALYVVVIGGNDTIDALDAALAGTPNASQMSAAIVTGAVTAISDHIERVLDAGGRRLVIANVPDLAVLPAVRVEAQRTGDEASFLAAASAVSDSFNAALDARLDAIEGSDQWLSPTPLDLRRFDLHAALGAAQDTVAAEGGNVTDACFDSDTYRDSPTAERIFHSECAPMDGGAPRFDDFVFWDDIHPTGALHAAIGLALTELLPLE
jgi:phospholipase/lecithinase/hemolysin